MSIRVTTRLKIQKPPGAVFEALVDPVQMRNYWFSSGSGRLEPGKTIIWRYDEYNAQVDIRVLDVVPNQQIVFQWPNEHVVTIALQAAGDAETVVDITETGWIENDEAFIDKLLDNKEGWVYVLTCLKAYLEFGVNKLRAALVK